MFSISGCAITEQITFLTGKSEDATAFIYPSDPLQKDHWLDNVSAWRHWDINDPVNQEAEWSFAENGLTLEVSASEMLNLFNGRPHSAKIKVIQFSDVAGYKVLASNPEGIRTMLTQQIEMLPNAIFVDQLMVVPGQEFTYPVDRHLDTQFIAVVTGFSTLHTRNSVRLLRIPVINEILSAPEPSILNKLSLGYLDEPAEQAMTHSRPAKLNINIALSEDRITSFSAKAY